MELIRFQFQRTERSDINLEVIAEGMLTYTMTDNKYITKEGLSPQGEMFMNKLEVMNTLFQNNIAHKVALSERESQDSLENGKIIQVPKKLYSQYHPEAYKILQTHYQEFFQIYSSNSVQMPSGAYLEYDGDGF